MSTNVSEISQLANILHQNGDKVLNALSKLSLNAVLLQKLNSEFSTFFENATSNEEPFQVIAPTYGNSQFLKDLHFLHDFIQKTIGLKLTNNSNLPLLNTKVNISKFKNIKYLEIKKIPLKEVVGLKTLQSQLESIICVRCLSVLEELLAKCGGDNSSEFVWSELREAVLSFNNFKVVDTSIALAPWLQVLDLSHNQITDVKAIECLPNLKYVNLSFNCLDVIPTFNKSARRKIELLTIKNNFIEDLSGLSGLTHLTELDLSNNWIANWDSLEPLLSVSTLQWLSLAGNPISCHNCYRTIVVGYLHISASFSDFYLDKIKLTKKEKSIVGIKLSDGNPIGNNSQVGNFSVEPRTKNSTNKNSDKKHSIARKSGKARLVVIPNLDDGTYEETPGETNCSDLMTSSTEHLITKKRIENTRSTYGIDNWLVQGGSVIQDILGLPSVQISTSTPCDDLCLTAALDSVKNTVTTVAVIETKSENQPDVTIKNNNASFVTCQEGDSSSNYFSAESSTAENNNSNYPSTNENNNNNYTINNNNNKPQDSCKNNDDENIIVNELVKNKASCKDTLSEEYQEAEEIEIDENEKLFVVLKERKAFNNEVIQEEMFLTITENELQERDATRGKISSKWSLTSLESCVKLKPRKLQLVFDTVRRDKKERTYTLEEEEEANALYKRLAEILESRTLTDMNQIVYKCESCGSQFSAEIKTRKMAGSMCCPFCHSKFILELDEVPLPSERKTSEPQSKPSEGKVSHNRSSSAGSAASLDRINGLFSSQNKVRKSESDIEILSNPSQSSIEVLDGPGRVHSGFLLWRNRSSEGKNDLDSNTNAAAADQIQSNQPTALTESSSSGSVTDSICTAYESTSTSTAAASNKPDFSKSLNAESQENEKASDETILQEVLDTNRNILKKTMPSDSVQYSFSDFTNFDHRIKLYLYTHVFDDPSEEFAFGIRATVSPVINSENSFPSCVIVSNKKLYFLKVIASEQGDDARNFLQKVDSLSFSLTSIKSVFTLTWHQGIGIKIQPVNSKWRQFLIILMDPARTRNLTNFLKSSDIFRLGTLKIIDETLERPYLSVQQLLLSSASLEETNIQYFSLYGSCSIYSKQKTREIKLGGILTNFTELLLLTGNLNWLSDGASEAPVIEYSRKFKNLAQVFATHPRIILQFVNGLQETEVWCLVMEGNECFDGLLKCIKESWEKLFTTPLKISSFE